MTIEINKDLKLPTAKDIVGVSPMTEPSPIIFEMVRRVAPEQMAKDLMNVQPIDLGKTRKTNIFRYAAVYNRMLRKFRNNHPIKYFFWKFFN